MLQGELLTSESVDDQETVDRIAQEHGPGTESREVREKMVKLLEDILIEAAKNSKSGSDPKDMWVFRLQRAIHALSMSPVMLSTYTDSSISY